MEREPRADDAILDGAHAVPHIGTEPVEVHSTHPGEEDEREPAAPQETEEQVFRPNVRLPETKRVVARQLEGFL
jgi:hypothetical protein